MNGSRLNTKVPKDDFQDYDIVYAVKDKQDFIKEPSWVDVFGERIIKQEPEGMSLFPPDKDFLDLYTALPL
jgi:aminoglycoside 6-adenylyltransferase